MQNNIPGSWINLNEQSGQYEVKRNEQGRIVVLAEFNNRGDAVRYCFKNPDKIS